MAIFGSCRVFLAGVLYAAAAFLISPVSQADRSGRARRAAGTCGPASVFRRVEWWFVMQ